MRKPRTIKDTEVEVEGMVLLPTEEVKELRKAAILLKAVKDAGYLDGHLGQMVMQIAHRDYNYHLL